MKRTATSHPPATAEPAPSEREPGRSGGRGAGGDPPTEPARSAAERLTCMEVWGGNRATDRIVRTTGLDTHTYSRTHGDGSGGGDVLYLTSCSSGRITRALLADVIGHGESASAAAEQLRQLMRRCVNILDQKKLVEALNEAFPSLKGLGRFASAVVVSYFLPTRRLSVCNAGHPPAVLYRARERSWRYLEPQRRATPATPAPTNLPLGFFEEVHYELLDLELEADDLVVLYTDGVIEAADPDGDPFGFDRLLATLEATRPEPMEGVVPAVLAAVERWAGGRALADDLSLMVLRGNDLAPTVGSDLLAPWRYLRHWLETRRRTDRPC